jgi:hypothetical protein
MLKPQLLIDQMLSQSIQMHRLVRRLNDPGKPGVEGACNHFPLQAFSSYLSSVAADLQQHLSESWDHPIRCSFCKQQMRKIKKLAQRIDHVLA